VFLEPCSSYIPGCPAPPKGQPPVPSPTKCWKLPSPLPLPFVIDGGLDGSWPRGGIANVTLLGEEATPGGRLGFSTCICVDPLTPFRPVCSRSNGLEVGWSSRALTHPKTGKQKPDPSFMAFCVFRVPLRHGPPRAEHHRAADRLPQGLATRRHNRSHLWRLVFLNKRGYTFVPPAAVQSVSRLGVRKIKKMGFPSTVDVGKP